MLNDCFFQSRWAAFCTEGLHIRLELSYIFDSIADVRLFNNYSSSPNGF